MRVIHKTYISITCAILIFIGSNQLFALNNIRFYNITPEEIPELAYVLCMHKDAEGYMWFGTYNGLIKYDGSGFRIFAYKEGENSISNSVVHVITEDASGNLWIGTENGLNKFNKKTNIFTSYTQKGDDANSLSSTHVRTIHIENDSTIWLGMRGGGVARFNPITQKTIHFRAGKNNCVLKSDDINCFKAYNDSIYYVGTENGGLYQFYKNTEEFRQFKCLGDSTIAYVHVDAFRNIWTGVWGDGLYVKLAGDSVFVKKNLLGNKIWTPKDIKEDAEGNIWIGTFGDGLVKYNLSTGKTDQILPIEQSDKSLAHSRIWSLLIDETQHVWVGSFGNAVSFYDKYSNKFPFVKTNIENPSFNLGTIFSVAQDKYDAVWLLADSGVFIYNLVTKEIVKWNRPKGLNETIQRLFFDSEGYLWLGCNGSIVQCHIKTGSYRVYSVNAFAPKRKNYDVNYLEEDKEGNIWVAIYEAGLYKLPKSQIQINSTHDFYFETYIFNKDSIVIPSNIIWQIAVTTVNDIWITTNSGFCKLNKISGKFESFSSNAHSSLYSKFPGVIWLGGLGSGLGKFEISTQKLSYFSEKDGLTSDIVFGIWGDYEGNLWAVTPKGISKYNPIANSIKNYDASDGIEDIRFSMNSCIPLKDGNIFCYSNTGFTIFNPEKIKDNPNTPKVIISDIKLYNRSITLEYADSADRKLSKPLSEISVVDIGYQDKMLTINFNAIFYSAPDQIEYAYQLQGFDKEWNYTTAQQRNATYTNLASGKYLFKVKASNADGIWSEQTTDLEIVVIPPIWKQWYFRLAVLLILIVAIIVFVRIQYAKIKKRFAFEEIKKEREIIRFKIDKLDQELEQKNNELTSKTLVLLHKNEKIKELKNKIDEVLSSVSKSSQPKVYSLLRFIQNEFENDQYWDQFEHQFNMTHNNFIDRFKEAYPKVNHKDLKVCAYIRMDLSNQEIANLLNVTLRGIEASRHRIRKKIKLDRNIALNDYIRNF